jgi:protocatechuate 3,4-dioxygenase beta subunit
MTDENPDLSRRGMIAAVGGIAGAAAWSQAAYAKAASPSETLRLTPTATDGPYYVRIDKVRSDITEGKTGVPLEVNLRVVDAQGQAQKRLRIDVWQCDTQGDYSGFTETADTEDPRVKGQTWLRGTQYTDDAGKVQFKSIYPGWYQARTPHFHIKAFNGQRCVLTAQMYFPDALSEFIYNNVPAYLRRKLRDTLNVTDQHKRRAGDTTDGAFREFADRYVADLTLTVDPGADVVPELPPAGSKPPYKPTEPFLLGRDRIDAVVPGPDPT